jgi:hypothetical protein
LGVVGSWTVKACKLTCALVSHNLASCEGFGDIYLGDWACEVEGG